MAIGVAGFFGGRGLALGDVKTGPGGGGSEVAELADPGRTIGFESPMLGLLESAYPL